MRQELVKMREEMVVGLRCDGRARVGCYFLKHFLKSLLDGKFGRRDMRQ